MTLDAASAAVLAALEQADFPPISEMTPQQARDFGAALARPAPPEPDMARVVSETVTAADGGRFGVRVFVPHGQARAVVVEYHAGGWVIGSVDAVEALCRALAARLSAVVVAVDYRLAPEHPYPAQIEDAWAALEWADAQMGRLAGRRVPLVVLGESAGGNLAAVVAQRARDRGGPRLAAQVLAYPVTDCDLETASYLDPDCQQLLDRDTMVWFWDHYRPDVASRTAPDVSPLRAADLSGLAPAVVLTAEHDPLRDEGEAYAEALRDAGVAVSARRFAGTMHSFLSMVGVLPASDAAIAHIADELTPHLDPGGRTDPGGVG